MDSHSHLPKSLPFKSKKPHLTTTPLKQKPSPTFTSISTPEKIPDPAPPTRIRNQHFALSLSDVRRAALQLRKLPPPSDLAPNNNNISFNIVNASHQLRPSPVKKSPALLPNKYEMLTEFFNAMVSSIRLLRLKRQPSTFSKLSKNIESLTDRRFSLQHLAQLKYIMPEVIVAKKIREFDEGTSCMKEELLILLETSALEVDNKSVKGSSGFNHLKEVFRSRITEYSASHPEGDDVPEGELPQLFYTSKAEPESSINEVPVKKAASLTSPSFKRRFSSRTMSASVVEASPAKPVVSSPAETVASPVEHVAVTFASPVKHVVSVLETPVKGSCTEAKIEVYGTPAELASTPARLMSATPALRTPKRSLNSPEDKVVEIANKSAKRRSLRFEDSSDDSEEPPSNADDEDSVPVEFPTATKDVLDILPKHLVDSLKEKERKIREEQDPVRSAARKRQKLAASLPKFFDMLRLLFQSMRSSVITKEQLIYKIIAGNLDIVDKNEVEDQLKLLQEVAPEYVYEKLALSGDVLLCLNKTSCAESVRAKLLVAK